MTFKDPSSVQAVMATSEHVIDSKKVRGVYALLLTTLGG